MEPQEELCRQREQHWEAQWQEFLQSLQAPHSTQMSPPESDAAPWGDAKAFLASFEHVAVACGWPRGEWVARLLPALSGGAQQAFSLLAAPKREDYGQVKAAILRGEALRREKRRQHFRQFCCPQLGDPRRMYSQVQELCCQWLKPERHSKEQILELLILEQFLAGLPQDAQRWVRARGPDSCAQALALIEDFMMSQRESDRSARQEPLQEWPLGPLEVKVECVDTEQVEISREPAEIFREPKPHIKEEASSLGLEKVHTASALPQEDQDMGEHELCGALGDQVEQEQFQQWVVGPTDVKEERLDMLLVEISREHAEIFGESRHSIKEEAYLPDARTGTLLQKKNSLLGGKKLMEISRRGQGRIQLDVPVMAEVQEEGCESNRRQGAEPFRGCKKSGECPEGLGVACSNPIPVDTEEKKALSSHYDRRNSPKSGIDFEHTGAECNEGPSSEGKIHPLDKHHCSQVEEPNHNCPELGMRFPANPLAKCKITHSEKKACKCVDHGKNLSQRSSFSSHQLISTEKKPFQYPECGEKLFQRSYLSTHHTGEKPHRCPQCGKSFTRRSSLSRHQIIHTGKKPHQCPECGKNLSCRSRLLIHLKAHTGEAPHKCVNCDKVYSTRRDLLRHDMIHTGKYPHKCPDCGKGFYHRSDLVRHHMIHTGEKPYKCPKCGKSFARRSNLLVHQKIHTKRNLMDILIID